MFEYGKTLEKALKDNPYDKDRGNESAYCRYLRYNVKGWYNKSNAEVKMLWKEYIANDRK